MKEEAVPGQFSPPFQHKEAVPDNFTSATKLLWNSKAAEPDSGAEAGEYVPIGGGGSLVKTIPGLTSNHVIYDKQE